MSIFDNAETAPTGHRVIGRTRAPMTSEPTGEIKPHTLNANEEWELRLTFVQRFWANRVQRPRVEAMAREAMAAAVFADVLRELPHLRLCIESGDTLGAHEAVDRIERATKP